MNTGDFVTYEQALALKRLGFKEECLYHYNICNRIVPNSKYGEDESINVENLYDSINTNTLSDIACDAPTLAQAQKWLRINKKLYISIFFKWNTTWYALVIDIDKPEIVGHTENCNSYEEALLAGITECLKFLEK